MEKEKSRRVKLVSRYHRSARHLMRIGNEEEEPIHSAYSETDLLTLRYIAEARECIMSEISSLLGVAPTTTTSLIDRLERRKLISRKRTDNNRRVVQLSLTKKGIDVVATADKEQDARSVRLLSLLTEEEQEEYIGVIRKLASFDSP